VSSVDESAGFVRSVIAAYRAATPLLNESMDMPDYEWLADLMGSPSTSFANTLGAFGGDFPPAVVLSGDVKETLVLADVNGNDVCSSPV